MQLLWRIVITFDDILVSYKINAENNNAPALAIAN